MLTVEQIKQKLEDANLRKVAEKAGLTPGTMYKFMSNSNRPSYDTVLKLSNYLEGKLDN